MEEIFGGASKPHFASVYENLHRRAGAGLLQLVGDTSPLGLNFLHCNAREGGLQVENTKGFCRFQRSNFVSMVGVGMSKWNST